LIKPRQTAARRKAYPTSTGTRLAGRSTHNLTAHGSLPSLSSWDRSNHTQCVCVSKCCMCAMKMTLLVLSNPGSASCSLFRRLLAQSPYPIHCKALPRFGGDGALVGRRLGSARSCANRFGTTSVNTPSSHQNGFPSIPARHARSNGAGGFHQPLGIRFALGLGLSALCHPQTRPSRRQSARIIGLSPWASESRRLADPPHGHDILRSTGVLRRRVQA